MKHSNMLSLVIDMRNSSLLIKHDNALTDAEKTILDLNKMILQYAGNPIYSQSTGDGYILIYDAKSFMSSYQNINELIIKLKVFFEDLNSKHGVKDYGYGFGAHISSLSVIEANLNNQLIRLMIGQCVNTSTKYAYYHNRSTLSHKEFNFNGVLTTLSVNTFLKENGFVTGDVCKPASGLNAIRLEKFERR